MTDEEVAALLRSDSRVVLIEAPAGCGKTYQAAEYARDAVTILGFERVLVLTKTHAACSVVAKETRQINRQVEIRTIDGLIFDIAKAYRIPLGLPDDVSLYVQKSSDGWRKLAGLVAQLLHANPMVTEVLAKKFPVIICDEHQDSDRDQERVVLAISSAGSYLRIFGDPMQIIPAGRGQDDVVAEVLTRWEALKKDSDYGELEVPHRWKQTDPQLGHWILEARAALKDGQSFGVPESLPSGLEFHCVEKASNPGASYRINPKDCWAVLGNKLNSPEGMMCVAAENRTVLALRSSLSGRLPIWEGHTRSHLENLVRKISDPSLSVVEKTNCFIYFLKEVLVGFTKQESVKLLAEVEKPSEKPRGKLPPEMKAMAIRIRENPDHRGFANAALHLRGLIQSGDKPFEKMKFVLRREFNDLINLREFEDASLGLSEISSRWSRMYPSPPDKCLSTVHKAKGLQSHTVVVFACDGEHFADRPAKRNLLYVALSRATNNLVLVTSNSDPCPLLEQ